MPNEKLNEEDIRKIMDKARKVALGGKIPAQKTAKEKADSGGEKEKPSKEGNAKTVTAPKDPEKAALKKTVKELTKRLDKVEGLLGKAMAQAAGEGSTQEKKTTDETGQQEVKGKEQQEITPEQELAMLQQAQAQQQIAQGGGQTGQGETPPSGNVAYIWLIGKALDSVSRVLPAALQRGGGGGEGGDSFSKVAEALMLEWLKRSFAGGGGGGNNAITLDQLKAFTDAQKVLAAGIFDTIKGLPKPTGQKALERLVGGSTEEVIE